MRMGRPNQIRRAGAAIVDLNNEIMLPNKNVKKNNKNDYYRFLISNSGGNESAKMNNDFFIPRSILKKSYVPGSVKEQRLE